MCSRLFWLSLKSLFIIFLLSVFKSNAMELKLMDSKIFKLIEDNEPEQSDFNLLECLSLELLLNILMKLPYKDIGFTYLRRHYKAESKELAEMAMDGLWKKIILMSHNLQEVQQRIENKYRDLGKDFPNYNTLNAAYQNVAMKALDNLTTLSKHIYLDLKANLKTRNWIEFEKNINQFSVLNIPSIQDDKKQYYLKHSMILINNVKSDLLFDVLKQIICNIYHLDRNSLTVLLGIHALQIMFMMSILRPLLLEDTSHSLLLTSLCIIVTYVIGYVSHEMFQYRIIKPIFKHTIAKINDVLSKLEKAFDEINTTSNI